MMVMAIGHIEGVSVMSDLISRRAAIDAVDSETVSTNPEHFKSSEKFIKFMDDADIASFGKWQWANGFNTAVVAAKIQLKKLSSAQPELDKNYMPEQGDSAKFGVKTGETCTDCISRQAAIDAIRASTSKYTGFMEMELYTDEDAVEAIEGLPSAQPEIIRCKDCKYATMTAIGQCKYCDVWFPDEAEYMSGDHFCASAERRQSG